MQLHCREYPTLLIPKHGVQFIDGVAEVPDEIAKTILAESPLITAAPDEKDATPGKPARRR